MVKRVALLFWGLTRSLKYTIDSINENILDVLKTNNYDYNIFIHTYYFNHLYSNIRTHENNIQLDFDEYKILNAKEEYVILDNQDEIDEIIDLKKYRTKGDVWYNNYNSLDNMLRALYSLNRVTELFKKYKDNYDYVLFLRPDVKYVDKLNIEIFNDIDNEFNIIPHFQASGGYNDRMFAGIPKNAIIYGEKIKELYDYSINNQVHAETYNMWYLNKHNIKIKIITDFLFKRVRANGFISNDF